jgi:GNAT superfamily N-acetyltransferase
LSQWLTVPAPAQTIAALERAALAGWPATVERSAPGGWLLRATPGLDRGRSNHALAPDREIDPAKIDPALERVRAFAAEHGIGSGIQVSPLHRHDRLMGALDARGWTRQWPALVLTGPLVVSEAPSAPGLGPVVADHADGAWLDTWDRCEPGRDVAAHAATVFRLLRGRAAFVRLGQRAVGIGVPAGEWLGMFCLAVDPEQRRAGLGTALVGALTSAAAGPVRRAYLQVEETNLPARAMYERLGFIEAYRYCHRVAASR